MLFSNVIVFGDSLSDIGIKVQKFMGKFASTIGEMTTSPNGRFSDCRNWTDHMYEDASGSSLVSGSVSETKTRSRKHQSLTQESLVRSAQNPFFYANYAMGGDCGGPPVAKGLRLALGTFKDQVKAFKKNWDRLYPNPQARPGDRPTLFLVWFGANDLYTAGASAAEMTGLAFKMAVTRRQELIEIVGPGNANFIYCNLPGPRASFRYNDWETKGFQRGKLGPLSKTTWTSEMVDILDQRAQVFNGKLEKHLRGSAEIVDIARAVGGAGGMKEMFKQLGRAGETPALTLQPKGTSTTQVSPTTYGAVYGNAITHKPAVSAQAQQMKENVLKTHTSDKVHPTDQVYKYMWQEIRKVIKAKAYRFGNLS